MEALRQIIKELIAALTPLIDAAHDPNALEALFKDLGWTPTSAVNLPPELTQAGSSLVNLNASINVSDGAEVDIPITDLVNAIKRLVDAINAIRNIPDGAFPAGIDVPAFKLNIARDLIDYTFVEHLQQDRHRLGGALKLAGIIRETPVPASGSRAARVKREVMWNRIGNLLTDPLQGFREV